ncbi:MAG: T9SS type A sorting domain-containing protein [Bacteroidales bacterium]
MKKRIFILLLIISISSFMGFGNTTFAPPPPINDECSSAILITPTSTNLYTTYSNDSATVSSGIPLPGCATFTGGGDVWFSVMVPVNAHLFIDSKKGTMNDAGMAVYSGGCSNLTLLACNDNKACGPDPNMPQIDLIVPAFQVIFIRFWGNGNNNFGTFQLSVVFSTPQPSCTNLGFENDYSAWFATLGQQYEVIGAGTPIYVPLLFNNTTDPNFAIDTSGIDQYGGFPKVYAGTKSLRIGNTATYQTYDGASVEQSFTVDTNTNFIINYAVVLETGGHPYNEQPFFKVDFFKPNGNSDTCNSYTLALPNSGLLPAIGGNPTVFYKPWTKAGIDLTAYLGQNVTVRFTVSDCSPGAHFGYAYIDCSCAPFKITSSHDTICAGDTVTLTAPSGGSNYIWSPGAETTQSIVVNPTLTTTYSCTITSIGGCSSTISKTIYIGQLFPPPASAGNISSLNNDTVIQNQNNVLYVVSPIIDATTYIWSYSGNGANFFPSNITTSDSVFINFDANATSGNLTVKGHNNCGGDGTVSPNYPINVTVGVIENVNNLKYNLFPNPCDNILNIDFVDFKEKATTVSIYSITGIEVLKSDIKMLTKSLLQFDISSLSKGMYFVEIKNDKQSSIKKFVKE